MNIPTAVCQLDLAKQATGVIPDRLTQISERLEEVLTEGLDDGARGLQGDLQDILKNLRSLVANLGSDQDVVRRALQDEVDRLDIVLDAARTVYNGLMSLPYAKAVLEQTASQLSDVEDVCSEVGQYLKELIE